jgi:polysaccharide pyruvyl transferase CsaB
MAMRRRCFWKSSDLFSCSVTPSPNALPNDCILIAGYYGYGNTGDEAILSAIVQEVRLIETDAHLLVLSGNPPETAARFGVEAFHAIDAVARLVAIERSRLVIIGGGGLFHDYWGVASGTLFMAGTWGMCLFLTIALYAALRRIPVMLWALGVGPLLSDEGRATARAICQIASVITVRDAYSGRELEAIGIPKSRIRVTADPVFSTPPVPAMTARVRDIIGRAAYGNRPLIGVCVRHWDVAIDPHFWETRVAEALDQAAIAADASVVFIPYQSGKEFNLDDVAAAGRVRAGMRSKTLVTILPESLSVRETWALIGACNCVLGMRFHAGVAAATRSVPFVTLSYDPKVTALMDELGWPDLNMDIGSVDADKLAELIGKCLAGGAEMQRTLTDACIRLGIRGRENARAAREILSGTLSVTPGIAPEAGFGPLNAILAETIRKQAERVAAAPEQLPPADTGQPVEPAIEHEPLISVVLPVWNHKNFIGAAIRSVLAQTWRNLELIVIDDGSDENLAPELDAAIQGDPRARVVRRSHEGLPRSLSAGFRIARGEYFTWTSADNIVKPRALELMVRFLLRHPGVSMTYANMELIDDEGRPLIGSDYRVCSQRRGASNELVMPSATETLGLAQDNFLGACFLYRGETGRWLGDYDPSRTGVEDYEYWLRLSASARIAHLDSDECLYTYRVHDDSLSVREADVIVTDVADLMQYHRARVEFYWQPFHVAIVVDPETPGLGRTAANLALTLRRMRHNVTEFDSASSPGALDEWAKAIPYGKKFIFCFGNCRVCDDDVLCFHCQSRASDSRSAGSCRILRSSKRIGESNWPLLPAFGAAYEDLLVCMKARGDVYPMWDLPDIRNQLFLYMGPVEETSIDWAAIESLASANPAATIAFVSTDSEHRYDPRIRIPSALYLGPRPPMHRYGYLSHADLLIAPLSDAPGTEDRAYDILMAYLAAGKPVVATPVIDSIGFADLPNARISEAADFGEAAQRALRIHPDRNLATEYMEGKSHCAFAKSILAAANNELYRRLNMESPGK